MKAHAPLAVALAVWMVLSLLWGGAQGERPRARAGVVAAQSVARDLDLRLTEADRERAGELVGPLWARRTSDGLVPVPASQLLPLLTAPLAWILPEPALAVAIRALELLLLAAAALLAAEALRRRGDPGALWTAAVVFGSATWLVGGTGSGDGLRAALALAAAACLLCEKEPEGPQEIYGGPALDPDDDAGVPRPTRAPRTIWLAAACLGLVAADDIAAAVLLLPALCWVSGTWSQKAKFLAAAALPFVLVVGSTTLLAGSAPWSGTVTWLAAEEPVPVGRGFDLSDVGRDIDSRSGHTIDLATGWSATVDLVAGGRHGLVVGALPLLVALLAGRGGPRFGVTSARLAMLMASAAWMVWRPFDLAGAPVLVGHRTVLPLLGFLAILLVPRPAARWSVACLVVGLCLLVPAPWLYFGQAMPGALPTARDLLPLETTQSLAGASEGVMLPTGVWVRAWGEDGLRLRGGGVTNRISLARPRDIDALVLELSRGAPAQVDVRGAEVGELMLRPDDTVALQLELGEPARRHRVWWGDEAVSWYELRVRIDAPGSWGFSVRPGRLR